MKLWTIQSVRAWNVLKTTGRLRANPDDTEPTFRLAYGWISRQMALRIGPPPGTAMNPLWAWYKWHGESQALPDLRASGHLERGVEGVCIELEVDERRALISDFDLWHYVLNYWYLPVSEADGDAFECELAAKGLSFFKTKPLPHSRYHRAIEASWGRLFDLNFSAAEIAVPRERKSLQACLWEISLNDVNEIKNFRAR